MSDPTQPRPTTSASNIHRRRHCPGSHAAEDGRPEEESPYASEGTMLHNCDADPTADRSQLTGEQSDTLNAAANADKAIFVQLASSGLITPESPYEDHREQEYWFRKGIKKLFPGHMDLCRWYPNEKILLIIDKKFGRVPVDAAASNDQLRAYAVMGAQKFPARHVVVAIVQPRLAYAERITAAEYNAEALEAAKLDIANVWDAAHAPDAPRHAGLDWCKYCKAKLDCPEYTQKFASLATTVPATERINALSDHDLDRVYVAIQFAKDLEKPAKEEIRRRMEAGTMGNFSLKSNGNMTKVRDVARARDLLIGLNILPAEEVDRCLSISIEEVSDKLRMARDCSMKDAKIMVKDLLADLLEITPKASSLIRKDDLPALPATDQPALL